MKESIGRLVGWNDQSRF